MEGYNNFVGCTLDALRFISEADIRHKNKKIKLKTKEGEPHIDSCMHLLGFCSKSPKIKVLRTEDDRRAKESNPNMLVRHSINGYEAQWCNIYAGRMREDYTPPFEIEVLLKQLSFDGNMIHLPSEFGKVLVEDFGNEFTS
jgi:hypothetical protein